MKEGSIHSTGASASHSNLKRTPLLMISSSSAGMIRGGAASPTTANIQMTNYFFTEIMTIVDLKNLKKPQFPQISTYRTKI